MKLELNVVNFENEDVIATSKNQVAYALHYDDALGNHEYFADYVTGKGASGLPLDVLGSCTEEHGADCLHIAGTQQVCQQVVDTVPAAYVSNGHINDDAAKGVVFHWDGEKFYACDVCNGNK